MKTAEFDYELPKEFIAQDPVEPRDSSRLMIVHRNTGEIEHRIFRDIESYLIPGDCLVINDTKVIPARLKGRKAHTGGSVEIFLLSEVEHNLWEALVRPGRRLSPGTEVVFGDGRLVARIEKRLAGGERLVAFHYEGDFNQVLEELGEVPLPPYITKPLDTRDRYQTIYARERGSVAAPTAGLHFTPELMRSLEKKGVTIVAVNLRVGLDTFRPVREEVVEDHKMHSEPYSVSSDVAAVINEAKGHGNRVIAVGTTSVRVLETAGKAGRVAAGTDSTKLFIYPGYDFKIIDAMITNFHLPNSTLLMMVAAFGGQGLIMKAYQEAIAEHYRFYSFGDAMFIV
ncbi:MAG: tRNA preQ1(34) S-adenosylmethionine ribosyltransferase-isomerase QueA [Candidatus Aquicultor secundus]|uniref:S-adenosylmethionine:tRNA ribosyltransferase-isomerase n=2 Tax=Candidatus Aquicultor secundus TaxID=1973895 RepID=A0A2M7T502_9ACTN|nr:tRNA preQ1(34) S-adenosylmethionine ribosyltransferase-isomerase QueA [Candidatus Aquicultor secundus]NCO65738.1 tRNA preQ1(34) S-adenosylmethionine ribosyltransferase-isomerase QueA [Solirubrobacter sp.]OIO88488.1 MAG: tRNA preQ1(34) S-adenosylmethionine ribosyltransferase-isomerase QueA [Candidatus Aquicultor secundus]PIU26257.1 MAG: tRNA preQ1(34) S-adenosylmethionine ribosyltransferase-isomerase QueA [Candidatus Aquicultor secundus]PIW22504.1 MAG: tRNA preQ1(34) S-adenosylmethionine ribo